MNVRQSFSCIAALMLAGTSASCGSDGGPAESPLPSTAMLEVRLVTSGSTPDPDGFTVVVNDGVPRTVEPNGSFTVEVGAGPVELQVTGLAKNCSLAGPPPTTTATAGSTFTVTVEVSCPAAIFDALLYTLRVWNVQDQLHFLPREGGDPERLIDDPSRSVFNVAPSPTGTHLALVERQRLTLYDMESGETRQLSPTSGCVASLFVQWVDSGSAILSGCRNAPDRVIRYPIEGSPVTLIDLGDLYAKDAVFIEEEDEIVVLIEELDLETFARTSTLNVYDGGGALVRSLAQFESVELGKLLFDPVSRHLLVTVIPDTWPDESRRVARVPLDGGEPQYIELPAGFLTLEALNTDTGTYAAHFQNGTMRQLVLLGTDFERIQTYLEVDEAESAFLRAHFAPSSGDGSN